ncbi:DNA repair protein RadC [Aggregatibacter aphrophilus]|uniref:DNA repair protein RadC n=1 Tax=Aggregatibacter aphrophilus TaxID=732 RepID=A0ABX9VYL5_AGGAP|nr:DNA repair protein RadC [Aggregatibacter aphrophilus]RMW91377.1 DNA repair protein RadC [Aggregatibacter aphrophilus]
MDLYFGDIPICYSHSVAMTLHSYGYDFRPEYLEAIMVMGNGASVVKNDAKHPLIFFDNGMPDRSISHSLRILGFEYEEFFCNSTESINVKAVQEKLRTYLKNGPVIIGPLDMGYLTYNPNHEYLKGVDHFVCVFGMDSDAVYLHDPAGYPCMKMIIHELLKAWQAENIDYKRGAFSMWGNIKRRKIPTSEDIYHDVSLIMKKRYEHSETKVIEDYAKAIKNYGLNQEQKQLHQFFSFRLASVRNIYMSQFLKKHDHRKAELKEKLAFLFGQAHLDCLKDDFIALADTLMTISELDNQFKELCIQYKK